MSKKKLEIGDRIVVMGRPEVARVAEIKWSKKDFRYEIIVDWGAFGKSRVNFFPTFAEYASANFDMILRI